jgi:tetratricopeptide (TPR) repeat protein
MIQRFTLIYCGTIKSEINGPLRTDLNKILAEGKEVASHVAGYFIECALAEHDHTAAAMVLDLVPVDGTIDPRHDMSWPRDWHVGLVAHCFKDDAAAKNAFTSARPLAAKTVSEQPDYAPAWSILGAIDAGLGRKNDAIAEGKRACELLPMSKDAWDGVGFVSYLALIYSWLGEKDLAFEQLATAAKSRTASPTANSNSIQHAIPCAAIRGSKNSSPRWRLKTLQSSEYDVKPLN